MTSTYNVSGMTCQGCVSSVKEKLSSVDGVKAVEINLEKAEAKLVIDKEISLLEFKAVLPEKYVISTLENKTEATRNASKATNTSKLKQLKPLLLIFVYLFTASFLLNYKAWSLSEAMLDFMGLFYIVFSFFKFLDLKGFPESFKMYDPLAKAVPAYGWVYPFIELALGFLFLMRFQITAALIITIVILGITTVGVTKSLLNKNKIQCACLGTALKLPMTEATFIENTIMLGMAISMLAM